MTRKQRLFYWFLMLVLPGEAKRRTEFMRKHHIYGSIGQNCLIQKKKIPLYSNLIFIHDNVNIASNVGFVTHDIIHLMLNNRSRGGDFIEKVGCIEIMNNVFIGSSTQIKYNTHIGNNVIIGANSFVTKDIPDNSVYAGVPARYICSFDEYVAKHKNYSEQFRSKFGRDAVHGVDDKLAAMLYEDFLKKKGK